MIIEDKYIKKKNKLYKIRWLSILNKKVKYTK